MGNTCKYKGLPEFFAVKGWGFESWLVNNDKYCGKILFFKKGKRCSFHFHHEKTETFYCANGLLKVWYSIDDQFPNESDEPNDDRGIITLEEGDVFQVPVGLRHQMLGLKDTWIYEFSTTHKEEDSYRIMKGD